MRIDKAVGTGFFVRFTGPMHMIALCARVRDEVLPHTHCYLDIDENGDLVLTPTYDKTAYSATITGNQMKLSGFHLRSIVGDMRGRRIRCEKRDGKIICKISEVKP